MSYEKWDSKKWPVGKGIFPGILHYLAIGLKKGRSEILTIQLQKMLHNLGYLEVGAYYYPGFTDEVEQAVKKFQKDHNLKEDGVITLETRRQLNIEYLTKNYKKNGIIVSPDQNYTLADKTSPIKYDAFLNGVQYTVDFLQVKVQIEEDEPDYYFNRFVSGLQIMGDPKGDGGLNTINFNEDNEALSTEATIKVYTIEKLEESIYRGQMVRIKLTNTKKDDLYALLGYVDKISIDSQDTTLAYTIQVKIEDSLEWKIQNYNKTDYISNHIHNICELCSMDRYVHFNEKYDKQITLTSSSSTNTSTDGTDTTDTTTDNTSTGTKTISECFDMATVFKYPGLHQRGTSTHDPEEAYNAYLAGTRYFDCFGASAFLFYVIKNFANKPVRVIHRHGSGRSGTHYTVQLKDSSGNWYDPREEYRKLTYMLRVNSGRILGIHQVYEG